ncbi:hypothetical protein FITA111629_14950 [Filibacter tadaridae]|uniref:Uncharacterized protein n=1 Tax=Filibacter tadaridae TaxID=2483811 RepID=A0A3P5WP03_9BACL|nr:hypothetical protein [Filibacter tadaridae]VDC23355.1 hypothetical protein FILTAD_00874 [Filibacter tadaridae]
MKNHMDKIFNLIGYIGVVLLLVVMYKIFFDWDDQFYSGVLFIGLILILSNINFLKKVRKLNK